VLIGATPGIVDDGERDRRRAADAQLARRLLQIGVDAFLDEWLSGPLFASLGPAAACRDERASNTAAGLAASLERCGTGTQAPLWDRLPELDMPVLALAGATDERFAAIGARMVERIGANAGLALVDGAGHAAHLERPEVTAHLVLSWLASR
jgi:pimeloyl-ACP methyl ester carboxylesterase